MQSLCKASRQGKKEVEKGNRGLDNPQGRGVIAPAHHSRSDTIMVDSEKIQEQQGLYLQFIQDLNEGLDGTSYNEAFGPYPTFAEWLQWRQMCCQTSAMEALVDKADNILKHMQNAHWSDIERGK